MSLQEIESAKITILVDNITDRLLPSSSIVKRPPMISNQTISKSPIAEHGFSALLEISYVYENATKTNKILFDTGVSKEGIVNNSDVLGINLKDIETIVLSHGHFDHISGLISTLGRLKKSVEIIAHPEAFLRRWLVYPNGNKARMDFLDEEEINQAGGIIRKVDKISFLPRNVNMQSKKKTNQANNRVMITGEIPRVTEFEKGFPLQYKEQDNEINLVPDPLVSDDQALIMNVKNKGLIILTGCGHAGIVNTIKFAKKVTGIKKIYCVIGGFHLSGQDYEDSIPLTIAELTRVDPQYIVPCHCTGWKATNKIIDTMPEKFIQSSVGSTFYFEA
ncbi:MAG: MBL fold metallo-hydrolase [Nitrososphaeraceae archaeon]|nr:MBL fold metallo-hydrolase [Nitrososphaeraceae archaeon]MDW0169426.1 MBL fold metallo-hydrolase [Nitrososphaeraceae archaeon]MDW0171782.1 MBL fold metallo-hydrolase [Nitrososphaeraceae archaeon]MDW0178316.1 MBL fold metallo-hydrolase [Nitrososphaeraceae archaeon]MDW0179680.1 MBL fold metallo-hydrolase [Nitrososphaeraceae archaeon]